MPTEGRSIGSGTTRNARRTSEEYSCCTVFFVGGGGISGGIFYRPHRGMPLLRKRTTELSVDGVFVAITWSTRRMVQHGDGDSSTM